MNYEQKNSIPLPFDGQNHSHVSATINTIFDWKYEMENKGLMNLYEKGKKLNWNSNELPWDTEVDVEKIAKNRDMNSDFYKDLFDLPRALTSVDGLVTRLFIERNAFMLSQFLHGEQGALIGAARLVQVLPDEEQKFYAASQVIDEARHVEVFHRYLTEKLGTSYPILPALRSLLDEVVTCGDWDQSFLGMQILIEGIALGAFSFIKMANADEPLIEEITDRVTQDESRHVAFGVHALENVYKGDNRLSDKEMKQREDFVIEASHILNERLNADMIFDRLGVRVTDEIKNWNQNAPMMRGIRHMTFSKVVPNLKRVGMLRPRVRDAYEKMDLLHFEKYKDSIEEEAPTPPAEMMKILMAQMHAQ